MNGMRAGWCDWVWMWTRWAMLEIVEMLVKAFGALESVDEGGVRVSSLECTVVGADTVHFHSRAVFGVVDPLLLILGGRRFGFDRIVSIVLCCGGGSSGSIGI